MTFQTLGPATDSVLPMVELRPVGPLDVSSLISLSEQLDDALSLSPKRLVVDLSRCDYIDAQAIRVLLDGHRALWLQGGRLLLRSVNPAAMRLLSIAGVQDVFTFEGPPLAVARAGQAMSDDAA